MKIQAMLAFTVLALLTAVAAGCAAPASIPAGEWRGIGTYVDYEAVPADGKPPATRARDAHYQTFLKIDKTRAFGAEAYNVFILSKRGKLFNINDEQTKLEFVLVKLETLANGTVLYAALDGSAAQCAALPPDAVAVANAVRTHEALVLQIDYTKCMNMDRSTGFTDTFWFQADGTVVKMGSISEVREAQPLAGAATKPSEDTWMRVAWVERLRLGKADQE